MHLSQDSFYNPWALKCHRDHLKKLGMLRPPSSPHLQQGAIVRSSDSELRSDFVKTCRSKSPSISFPSCGGCRCADVLRGDLDAAAEQRWRRVDEQEEEEGLRLRLESESADVPAPREPRLAIQEALCSGLEGTCKVQ